MKKATRHPRWRILLYTPVVLVWLGGLAHADEVTVNARITHEISKQILC